MIYKLITKFLFFYLLITYSCIKTEKDTSIFNEFNVTKNKDTLESGYWRYNASNKKISKEGNYKNGYKLDQWLYILDRDTVKITWKIYDSHNVKFNIPDFLESVNTEYPLLYQGDINDNDNNTYITLLRYDLNEVSSSIYTYLYEANNYLNKDKNKRLISKDFKKFTFKKGLNIFKIEIVTENKDGNIYLSISYVFQIKNYLYDLTYKNLKNNTDDVDLEVFNDIFYSIDCNGVDLFNHFSKKYLNEENVVFEDSPAVP